MYPMLVTKLVKLVIVCSRVATDLVQMGQQLFGEFFLTFMWLSRSPTIRLSE